MTRHRLPVFLILLVSVAAPAWSASPAADVPVEQRVVALVFANSMATWTGSGFAVGDGRWIVTNHHVATRKFSPDKYLTLHDATVLSPWTGRAHRARVVAVDQQTDLALLRLEEGALPSLPLAAGDFLDRPPPLPRPPVMVYGYPSVADRAGWEGSEAAHSAQSYGLGMTARNDVPVLMLAPTAGPAKGWSGGPAIWMATKRVVGSFNALVSVQEQPDRWMPQVIGISHLRSFLVGAGVDPITLDRGVVPPITRPADATPAFHHFVRITSAVFADDWTAAEREARALTQLRPLSPEAHRVLGTTLAAAGKHEPALKALDESRRLAPNAAPTLYHRALALRELSRPGEAEAEVKRVVAIDADDHEAWILLGKLQLEQDRPVEARDSLRRAVKLAPYHPFTHWDLGLILRRLGETQEGLAECKIAVDLTAETEPLRPLRVSYARMLAQAGRSDEAEKELREAIRLDNEDPGFHLALASFLADANRKEEARKEAEKALALKPDDTVREAARALLKSLGPAES